MRDNLNAKVKSTGGVGRNKLEREKLVLCRVLDHDEMSFFTLHPVSKWRVLNGNRCYICEGWKYVLYIYDRSKHRKNISSDIIQKLCMLWLNKASGNWNIRRVSPKIHASCLWDGQPHTVEVAEMCPLLIFAARIDPKLQT